MQDLGETVIDQLLLDWLKSFLTVEEQDRLLGFHLGGELFTRRGSVHIKL